MEMLSKREREKIALWNEVESTAEIYTHNLALQKQLSELCRTYPEQVRQTDDNRHGGLTFVLPKKWLRVVPPRVLSPAQREVLNRMNANRHNKGS